MKPHLRLHCGNLWWVTYADGTKLTDYCFTSAGAIASAGRRLRRPVRLSNGRLVIDLPDENGRLRTFAADLRPLSRWELAEYETIIHFGSVLLASR